MYISMATAKEIAKQNRHLFQEMPCYGVNFTQSPIYLTIIQIYQLKKI